MFDNNAGGLTASALASIGLRQTVSPSANSGAYSAETFDPNLKVSTHPNIWGNADHQSVQSKTSHLPNYRQPSSTSLQATHYTENRCLRLLEHWLAVLVTRCTMYGQKQQQLEAFSK